MKRPLTATPQQAIKKAAQITLDEFEKMMEKYWEKDKEEFISEEDEATKSEIEDEEWIDLNE